MSISDKPVNDWFKGVPKGDTEAKNARMAELKAAEPVFKLLTTLLERDIEQRRKAQVSNQRYEEPQWAYKQADFNGGIRELERILKMLPINT